AAQVAEFKRLMAEWEDLRWRQNKMPLSLMKYLEASEFVGDVLSNVADNPFRPALKELAKRLRGMRQRHVVTGEETSAYLTLTQVAGEFGVTHYTAKSWGGKAKPNEVDTIPDLGGAQLTPKEVTQRWREARRRGGLLDWLAANVPGEL